jgi:Domain of unknown function (DUF4148)
MNHKSIFFAIVLAVSSVAVTTNASAQGKTRAEVRQELIDAQNNGLNFVTDTSYPDVNPIYRRPVESLKMQHGGSGPATAGSSDTGRKAAGAMDNTRKNNECVGPSGFCNPYFRS